MTEPLRCCYLLARIPQLVLADLGGTGSGRSGSTLEAKRPFLGPASDAVDCSHPTASQCVKVRCHRIDRECLFLAISGLFGVVLGRSALPPKADIRARLNG